MKVHKLCSYYMYCVLAMHVCEQCFLDCRQLSVCTQMKVRLSKSNVTCCYLLFYSSPAPEVRRWGNLKETLLRFQRTHDFNATFEALTVGELAGDYFNALGSHRQELLRQHVG